MRALNRPALREAVAKLEAAVPYACNGEDHRTVMARIRGGEEAKRVLLAAAPALLDELEAARAARAVLDTVVAPSDLRQNNAEWVTVALNRAAWLAWQER